MLDNEEVGSSSRQGAQGTFLADTLARILETLGQSRSDGWRAAASSLVLSADNGHAVHPNHPEKSDPENGPVMNGGVVVKINASQKYTTDAMTAALFGEICRRVGVPVQRFANRADMPGGSTLGNLQGHSLSAPMLDIGLAQMAMHSAVETAGVEDIGSMIRAVRASIKRRLSAREMEAIESGDPAGEVSNAALQQKRVFRPGCAMLPQHRDMGEKIRVFKAKRMRRTDAHA